MITSLIRTWSAMLAAWLLSLPTVPPVLDAVGVDSRRAGEVVTGLVMLGLGWAWYLLARALEHHWPRLGVLLGSPTPPRYGPATGGTIPAGTPVLGGEEGPPGRVVPTGAIPSAPPHEPTKGET